MQNDLKNTIESLLFISDNPVDVRALKQIIPEADPKDIRLAIAELVGEYEDRQGGFLLYEVAGGFQFRTRPEYKEWIRKLVKPAPVRLSKASLETLAIIAYHQPIIRADVERIRGVDSGAIMRSLLERKLIRILGKKEIPGRPLIYATTRRFLEIFNLKNLSDMPSLKEIQAFGKEGIAQQFAAGTGVEVAPAEDDVPPGEGAEMVGEDGSAITDQLPETQGTEEAVYSDQDGDLSVGEAEPDEEASDVEADSDVKDDYIAEDEADSVFRDEGAAASGVEHLVDGEVSDMPEPGMDSPEYDETVSPDRKEDMPEQEADGHEPDTMVPPDQGVATPPTDGTEEPPVPEDENNT
ncbi:MAG: SMC-Scp complex subunit ScpB [Thermodesulfobacteriota bacterium]